MNLSPKVDWMLAAGAVLIGLLVGALAAVTGLMMNGLRLPVLVRLTQGMRPRRHTRAASHSKAWSRMPSAESSLAVAST